MDETGILVNIEMLSRKAYTLQPNGLAASNSRDLLLPVSRPTMLSAYKSSASLPSV